ADPIASPFGWHDDDGTAGAEYLNTRGNNVWAYEDKNNTNQFGFSPSGGSNLQFDYPYNPNESYHEYTNAAVTNLFYANNRIHDILYHYGFDAPSGNFQLYNYNNEGFDQDCVLAESQDGGGLNNANLPTPPDGFAPRMQMYLVRNYERIELLSVNTPNDLAGSYTSSLYAGFGPTPPSAGITADFALLVDDYGT